MNLLFYYPSNKRSNALETLIEEFSKRKINVIVLTTCEKGEFHQYLETIGVKTYTNQLVKGNSLLFYIKHILFLRTFCKQHKIDVVHSHLQQANIVSVVAQFFIKPKVIIFRHHFQFSVYSNDTSLQRNSNESLFDRIINRFAKIIIVPSSGVYKGMLRYEKVDKAKVKIIPYIYAFEKYSKPNLKLVEDLRTTYSAGLILLMCSRLIKFKRHLMVFTVVKKLVDEGFDIKMLVLDEGPEKNELEASIKSNNLNDRIFMLGFRTNFVDYMAAADVLVHPSLSEASNSAVKEMGSLAKPVMVCEGVGDFSDYIENEKNGFLMPVNDTEIYLEQIIRKIYVQKSDLTQVGMNLQTTVHSKFDRSEEVINMYLELLK